MKAALFPLALNELLGGVLRWFIIFIMFIAQEIFHPANYFASSPLHPFRHLLPFFLGRQIDNMRANSHHFAVNNNSFDFITKPFLIFKANTPLCSNPIAMNPE